MSNRLARSLDGGPRRGRSPDHTAPQEMADTLALPLRRVLVYVDPQTDLSSIQRRECRMTLNSYEKVIDARTSATKVNAQIGLPSHSASFVRKSQTQLMGLLPSRALLSVSIRI